MEDDDYEYRQLTRNGKCCTCRRSILANKDFQIEYIIKGDTERFEDCLVCVCGKSLEDANVALERMINNPTEKIRELLKVTQILELKKFQTKTVGGISIVNK